MVAFEPTASRDALHRVRIRYPGAEAVYVMGGFNAWSTTRTPMERVGVDGWEAWVPCSCGAGALRLFVWEPGRRHGRLVHVAGEASSESAAAPRS